MPTINDEIASAFGELADLLELSGADRYRILAYRRAAATLAGLARDVGKMSDKELVGLSGIGKATASKVREFIETGTMRALEDARAELPAGVLEMTTLPGMGPKKAMLLHSELGINTIDELRTAIEGQRLRELKGFGSKTEEKLLGAIGRRANTSKRFLLEGALDLADEILTDLRALPQVSRAEYAGSLRRMKETIGDLDILAAADDPAPVMEHFANMRFGRKGGSISQGPTKSSIVTKSGLQVDLRVVAPGEFGAALQYFTGSQAHNVAVREIAVKKGLKLSEYGLFTVEDGKRIAGATEDEIYQALGMQTPLPTMRENRGEIALAASGRLPSVVRQEDIKGDLHAHTVYSDGTGSVTEMVQAGAEMGYSYFAITDHGGGRWRFTEKIIRKQRQEIERVSRKLDGNMTVLQGVEMSIRPDGSFAFSDEVLASFDFVIASVHDALGMDPDAMTRRLIRVIEHPEVNIIGHPTSRRLQKRPPISFDLEEVFRAAAANDVALEISAHPERIDLKDDHVRLAREIGCLFSIDTDSHGPGRLHRMRYGVGTAQRAWVPADEVVNTWPLQRLKKFFEKKA